MSDQLLEMASISKSFGPVQALQDVSLHLAKGEIRALVGENGAGKSTLMKILSGAITADAGTLVVEGKSVSGVGPALMLEAGVAVIYQEFAQAPHLSVAENICLGRLPRNRLGQVAWGRTREIARTVLAELGYSLDVDARVGSLSVAERQIVEIARAIARNARLIVLDEPSAVLGETEISRLFALMRRLRDERQVGFIYVSHRLGEVFDICDSITVLRDGRHVETAPKAAFTRDRLIRQMVGRDIDNLYPERPGRSGGAVALKVSGLGTDKLDGIDLFVRQGEIVGLCGLSGAGRSEVLMALGGGDPAKRGSIEVFGRRATIVDPGSAIALGIGLVPEDRKTQGLCLNHSVRFNMSLAALGKYLKTGILHLGQEDADARTYVSRLHVKTHDVATPVANLSGGNQQKCLIGRQLIADTRILLIDEPTRGVDIGARREIYDLLTGLARDQGLAILMVSSELPEVLGLCDRFYVMREGRIATELQGRSASEEQIMAHAAQ